MIGSIDFVVPGSIAARTGGYRYDARIVDELRALGLTVCVHELDDSFPSPTTAALDEAGSTLAAMSDGSTVVIDGLAFGALPELAAAEAKRLDLVALVHHPLALETGLVDSVVALHREQETRALAAARRVVVTSEATAATLAGYKVPTERIRVVRPGVDIPRAKEPDVDARVLPPGTRAAADVLQLLCVATLTPRKDHESLLEALARIVRVPWHLICVGSLERDPRTSALLQRRVDELGLASRVTFAGEADDEALVAHYAAADLFVLASRYEGYGMVFDEAIAHGLAIVATEVGAVERIRPTEARRLVEVGDTDGLAQALEALLCDRAALDRARAAACDARRNLRDWRSAADEFLAALGHDDR